MLKTDVFEEANGDDQILFDLLPGVRLSIGMDLAASMARRARARCQAPGVVFLATDVRRIALATGSVDLVVSNSTLDHFDEPESFYESLREIARVLKPGGVAVIALDNPWNPLYPLLRWAGKMGWIPFQLGFTASIRKLSSSLEENGLEIERTATAIHNPRMISTLLFLAIRRLLGRHGEAPVRWLLRLFALGEHLPTRWVSACYIVANARKPV